MRLAVCCVQGAPTDISVWSGTPAYFVKALSELGEPAVLIGPIRPVFYRFVNTASGVTGKLGHRINWEAERVPLRHISKEFFRQLAEADVDAVVTMGWYPLGASPVPCFYWGDASMEQRFDKAPHWSRLSRRTRRVAPILEAAALRQLSGVFMPSRWASDGIKSEYCLSAKRVRRVPFGSNVEDPGRIVRALPRGTLQLLLVGVQWYRKGCDRAISAMDDLVRAGIDVHLHIVGTAPPDKTWQRSYVTFHGFLSKEIPTQRSMLHKLFVRADVLLLPSRSDPSPMVIGEAGAYSLPVVACDVGGVRERVSFGGVVVPADAAAAAIAAAIVQVTAPQLYKQFSLGSRRDFEERSHWAANARLALSSIAEILRRDDE